MQANLPVLKEEYKHPIWTSPSSDIVSSKTFLCPKTNEMFIVIHFYRHKVFITFLCVSYRRGHSNKMLICCHEGEPRDVNN